MRAFQWLSRRYLYSSVVEPPELVGDSVVVVNCSHRGETWIAAGVLLLILNAVFFPFLWGKKTLLASSVAPSILPTGPLYSSPVRSTRLLDPGSPAWQFEPSFALTHREYLSENNVPLWNPYRAFGTPFAATMQPQPFYPLTILASLDPGPRTLDIFYVLRIFLAGLFAYLFFRFFFSFFPALSGAVSLMLCGYFMVYFSLSHLSVEVLVAAVFYSVERLLRKPALQSILLVACIFFVTVVGGMPESAFLLWGYGYAYALFRLITAADLRRDWVKRSKAVVLASVLGFSWAAFLIFPFLELMRVSFDVHQFHNIGVFAGLEHNDLHGSGYALLRTLVSYLVPLLQGPPFQNIFTKFNGYNGLSAYLGTIPATLAIIAIVFSIRKAICRRFDSTIYLGLFFFTSSVLFWMKKFGSVAVNWIGRLPVFNLIIYYKYLEVLQAMAIASLAAIGCSYLLDRRIPAKWIVLPVCTVLLGLVIVLINTFPLLTRPSTVNSYFFYIGLFSAVAMLLLMLAGVFCFREGCEASNPVLQEHGAKRSTLGWCIVLLISAELSLNFLVPMLYIFNRPPRAKPSAYDGAPYVDFLKANTGVKWRIFGRDLLLFPNWSEAFGLFDVRSLDAMYYQKYFHFVRFFLKTAANPGTGDLVNRFIGTGDYDFGSKRQIRFFQLGSVRYLVAPFFLTDPDSLIGQLWHQNIGKLKGTPKVAIVPNFTIDGVTKPSLLEHPLFTRLPLHIHVPYKNPVLQFSIGIDSAVYAPPVVGGGVTFTVEGRDLHGRIRKLFSKYIDPKHNLAERRWFAEEISLRQYRGQSMDLLFSTDGGKDTRNAWSGWADMRIEGAQEVGPVKFTKVYDREVKIYQLDPVLPRAAVFHNVEIANDDETALSRLADPDFDIFSTAVVSAPTLKSSDQNLLQHIRNLPGERAKADITHYDSQRVTVSATLDKPGLLVLNDTDYPGWKAYVDGRMKNIISTNYLFRGVLLPPGSHRVDFKYEPNSFRIGLLLSCFSLLCAGIAVARACRRNNQ